MANEVIESRPRRLSELVGKEIKVLLLRNDISGRQLAAKLGVSQTWLSSRLAGTTPIDLNDLEAIAKALNVPVQDLLPKDPGSRVLTVPASPVGTAHRTADRPHVVDVRSHGGSVATAIRRPRRRSARPTGTPLMAAAGMVLG